VDNVVRTKLVDLDPLPRLSCPAVEKLAGKLERFLRGETVNFDLNIIALEDCSRFQKRVLLAEYGIPRGWVSTYGRIARRLRVPRGARAVGTALARNPFPIVIPCHRAVRSDGALGGFRGGLKMKRALLEMEGREFSRTGKVVMTELYY
jgi:methylated-DNA-[protein]-cysteine S-methyltransferase